MEMIPLATETSDWEDRRRIHQVCASKVSDPEGTEDFDFWSKRADKIEAYAKRLGFGTTHDNVDGGDDL